MNQRRTIGAGLGLLLAGAVAISVAFRGNEKIGWSVQRALDLRQSQMDIIVIMNQQADLSRFNARETKEARAQFLYRELTEVAKTTQQPLIAWLKDHQLKFTQHYLINAIDVKDVSADLIKELSQRDDIRVMVTDPVVQGHGKKIPSLTPEDMQSQGLRMTEDNLKNTGADKVWKELKIKGKGVVVAGQDTGVDWEHPALIKHYRGSRRGHNVDHTYNWHDSIREGSSNPCGYDTKAPCDDDQHGTHTMGTVVGDDGGSNAIGMAPEAQWIACRNMDRGEGKPSTYLSCFEFFMAPYPQTDDALTDGKPEMAPNVINNSWGCPPSEGCQGDEFIGVLENLKKAGIMVVVSAGNDGPGCRTIKDPPAHHSDLTLSVGAHNHRNNRIASFSSRGPSRFDKGIGPDLTAPGVQIRSSIPGGGYASGQWSGTSMASPHVVGAVALMWSANKALIGKIDETVKIITHTAVATEAKGECAGVAGTDVPNNVYGYGLLDVYAAVTKALEFTDDEG